MKYIVVDNEDGIAWTVTELHDEDFELIQRNILTVIEVFPLGAKQVVGKNTYEPMAHMHDMAERNEIYDFKDVIDSDILDNGDTLL